MENKDYTIGAIVAVIIVVIFFGGWYIFFGRLFAEPNTPPPITNTNPTIEPSGLITSTSSPQ